MEYAGIKILMTTDSVGGGWTYTLDLCRALANSGAEIHLAVMGSRTTPLQRKDVSKLPNVILYESEFKLEYMDEPWADLRKAREWLVAISNGIQPDVMHFNNFGQVDYPWDCPVITVYHSCVMSWWQAVNHKDAPQNWNNYRQLVKKALQYSDAVVFPTRAIQEAASNIYGNIPSSRVIYNGRDYDVADQITKE